MYCTVRHSEVRLKASLNSWTHDQFTWGQVLDAQKLKHVFLPIVLDVEMLFWAQFPLLPCPNASRDLRHHQKAWKSKDKATTFYIETGGRMSL
jgi:hypothetical protein